MKSGPTFIDRIAHGESSDIFLAGSEDHPRAVKVLHKHLADDPIIRSRFIRNVESLAGIEHPNVVRVHDLTEYDGCPAMIMDYVAGGSLAGRRYDLDQALEILRQLLSGLDAVHERGLVHRDIRPSHILLDRHGSPRLTDFGMASVRDLSGLTRSTVFTSKPHYVDPWSWGRGTSDPIQDLYSLGAVMFECVTGSPPPLSLFGQDAGNRTHQLSEFGSGETSFARDLVLVLLSSPDRRPRSAKEVLNWIATSRVTGARSLSECLYCGSPMPSDAPLCTECGQLPLEIKHDPDGVFIVLRKIPEDQDVLSPFLRKLQILSASRDPLPKLLIGDIRLYSRAEQKEGIRLPARIADGLSVGTACALTELLKGDRPEKVTIRTRPMSDIRRVKRGPLVELRPGVILPPATVNALRRLASQQGASASSDAIRGGSTDRSGQSELRKECVRAVAIAAGRLASDSAAAEPDHFPLDPETIATLSNQLSSAVDHLERTEHYLKAADLHGAYAALERSTLMRQSSSRVLQKTEKVFQDHRHAEDQATQTRQSIVEACRRLESVTPATLSQTIGEIRDLLQVKKEIDATD